MTDRDDLAWCTPANLPGELLALGGVVRDGLGVGAGGRIGVLDLALAPRGSGTTVTRHHQRAPLRVHRVDHLDPGRPDMAFVFLQQDGGLAQGDRYRVDIDCAPGSAVHVTTRTATEVIGVRDNFATRLVNVRAGAGAVLEYLPAPVVPLHGSRLFQRTCLTVARDATVILGEILLPGRTAAPGYDLYWADTECRRAGGRLLFADTLRLRPGGVGDPRSPGVLGDHDVVATLYCVCSLVPPADVVTLLRAALAGAAGILAGASELPGGCGAVLRVLGKEPTAVRAAMRAAWTAVRTVLVGAPAPDLPADQG